MVSGHGQFIWYELLTDDPEAATVFYGAVVGWTSEPHPQIGADDSWFAMGGHVAGIMTRPDRMRQAGGPPQWLGYVSVDDVDRTAEAALNAGGGIWHQPRDVEGIGRIALVTDRWGAPFYLLRPDAADRGGDAFNPGVVGRCGWNELATEDQAGAFDLYGRLFGWRKDGAMAMGEMGDYSFLSDGERQIGAIMGPIPDRRPRWRFYFRVADVAAAAAATTAGGGTIIIGPVPIPTGDHILIGRDPAGAEFALVGASG